MTHIMSVKTTIIILLVLISIGIFSKKRISLDYMITQENCQIVSVNENKIKLKPSRLNSMICEQAQKLLRCASYDQNLNQLSEHKIFHEEYKTLYETYFATKDKIEKLVINFKKKNVVSRQLNVNAGVETQICTGALHNNEQLRERFPELVAGKR